MAKLFGWNVPPRWARCLWYRIFGEIPKAVQGDFNVAIALLNGDLSNNTHNQLFDSLRDIDRVPGITIHRLKKCITSKATNISTRTENTGTKIARFLAAEGGYDLILWGDRINENTVSLLWASASNNRSDGVRYNFDDKGRIESVLLEHIQSTVALVVRAQFSATNKEGKYCADKLDVLVRKAQKLPKISQAATDDTNVELKHTLACALYKMGQERGTNSELIESIEIWRQVLSFWTIEEYPSAWAGTQNNLGASLTVLGERSTGTDLLEQAAVAYDEVFRVYTASKVPTDWAGTMNNLAVVLYRLGERQRGTAELKRAIKIFEQVIQVWPKEQFPIEWAGAQNNLGISLKLAGERDQDIELLNRAIGAFRALLLVWTREQMPGDWLMAKMNLASSIRVIGAIQNSVMQVEEAVKIFRELLSECNYDIAPLNWALIQFNLGNTLSLLSTITNDKPQMANAILCHLLAWKTFCDLDASRYKEVAQRGVMNDLKIVGENAKVLIEELPVETKTLLLELMQSIDREN